MPSVPKHLNFLFYLVLITSGRRITRQHSSGSQKKGKLQSPSCETHVTSIYKHDKHGTHRRAGLEPASARVQEHSGTLTRSRRSRRPGPPRPGRFERRRASTQLTMPSGSSGQPHGGPAFQRQLPRKELTSPHSRPPRALLGPTGELKWGERAGKPALEPGERSEQTPSQAPPAPGGLWTTARRQQGAPGHPMTCAKPGAEPESPKLLGPRFSDGPRALVGFAHVKTGERSPLAVAGQGP